MTSSYLVLIHPFRFSEQAAALNVSADALYAALIADAEDQPPNWDLQGRQANIWKLISESWLFL